MSNNTSINLVIAEDDNKQFDVLVNAGSTYYSDGIPVELFCKIMTAACDVINEWNQQHKQL